MGRRMPVRIVTSRAAHLTFLACRIVSKSPESRKGRPYRDLDAAGTSGSLWRLALHTSPPKQAPLPNLEVHCCLICPSALRWVYKLQGLVR